MPLNNILDHLITVPGSSEEWDLTEKIGEGTYGEVFKAQHKFSGQLVAMKILETFPNTIEEMEEFAILKDLCNHPNLPKFYGLYIKHLNISGPQLWIAMELCSGGSVSNFVKSCRDRGYRIDEMVIAYIIKDTLKALNHLHNQRVIHRDVKGPNILLTDDGHVKLLDFGVSAHLRSSHDRRNTSIGTPYWMAPEVIACEQQPYEYDVRCDIWSLGITTIELVDGKPPLYDQHPMRALFHTLRQPAPTVLEPSLSSDTLKDFIALCLIKDFEKRPFADQLLQHPFLQQVPENTTEIQYRIQSLLQKMDAEMIDSTIEETKENANEDIVLHDLTELEQLTEDLIVNVLKQRYNRNLIYTFVGDILIAVNPFSKLDIYDAQHSARYCRALLANNPPHIFATADQSYQAMVHMQMNQCIIISGESGAGKTESAHFLLQQMARLGQAVNRELEMRLAHINPLVEAFGNAQTVINGNSSRFGKYLELTFTASGKITGARLSVYLLEKSRVIRQAVGESNFHIFYYLLDSIKGGQNINLQYIINADSSWRYLAQNITLSVAGEKSGFREVLRGFQVVGFSQQEIDGVMNQLAAILHIGNIEFEEHEKEHHSGSLVSSYVHLVQAANLLGVGQQELQTVLTSMTIVASGETIVRSNCVQDACKVRDSIAKTIYGRLFDWIVSRINQNLSPSDIANMLNIGILDIFGFENFEKNSFEQLCINITNEQLQFFFNQHVFAVEQKEYIEEGLDMTKIEFTNNQSTLDMFLAKPLGLLAILDEESNFPKATDLTLVAKFQQNVRNLHFMKSKGGDLFFIIDHYAEQVEYDASHFLEKNQDRLPAEVLTVLSGSRIPLVKAIFSLPLAKTGNLVYQSGGAETGNTTNKFTLRSATNVHRGTTTQTLNSQTVATFFRNSLAELLSKMASGRPYFVRCIRPNVTNSPGVFDNERVSKQLLYTGMLETIKIRRQGYSLRITFHDFIKRYAILGLKQPTEKLPEDLSQQCQLLLQRIGLNNWAIGKNKVFLKYYHEDQLRQMARNKELMVVRIQACVRCVIAMIRYKRLRSDMNDGALRIQKVYRGYKARQRVKEKKRMRILMMWAVTILQKNYRMLKAKAERTRLQMDKLISNARTTIAARTSVDINSEDHLSDAVMEPVLEEEQQSDGSIDNVRQDSVDDNQHRDSSGTTTEQSYSNEQPTDDRIAKRRSISMHSIEKTEETSANSNDVENHKSWHSRQSSVTGSSNGEGQMINKNASWINSTTAGSNSPHRQNSRTLIRRISFKGMKAENSDPHIEDEHPAYLDEVHKEHDRHNLVHQLALQRRQSARSKFNRHQKIINSQQKIDSRKQNLEKKQNMLDDDGRRGQNRILKRQNNEIGLEKAEQNNDADSGVYDFRGILRKTNFDPEEQRLTKQLQEVNTGKQDFRSVLKPNGRKSNSFLYK